jgi:hypothetical protein
MKKADRNMVGGYCLVGRVPAADGKRRVSLEITLAPGQRACDPDSQLKSLLDSLVAAGVLKNDSHLWCECAPVTFARGPKRSTKITLEDL